MTSSGDGTSSFSEASLQRFAKVALESVGVPANDAQLVAASLVDADASGVGSHGVQRLPWYVSRLRAGLTNPRPNLSWHHPWPTSAHLDADGALGQVAAFHAAQSAGAIAIEQGLGCVGVRNSHHYGAGGYWARTMSSLGLLGVCTTNGGPVLAPWGGKEPMMGNDPLSVAVPRRNHPPIVLDMATTVAGGKIDAAVRRGERIPLHWALDADGRPTDDPIAARRGTLQPIAEYKGYGLTLILEILAAALSVAAVGRQVSHPRDNVPRMNVGHFFLAVRPDIFQNTERVEDAIEELAAQVHATTPVLASPIMLPGEPEQRNAELARNDGIHLESALVRVLDELACDLSIPELETHND